jgi:hypothetical protein
VVQNSIQTQVHGYFEKRRISRSVEDATEKVVADLLPLLHSEGIKDDGQQLLFDTCVAEVRRAINPPQRVFEASLSGPKLFELLYAEQPLPMEIREAHLEYLYGLIFPRIAHLVVSTPALIQAWMADGLREGFEKLNDLALSINSIGRAVDALASRHGEQNDFVFRKLQQSLLQSAEFQLDLTAFRGDQPTTARLEDFFILPQISQRAKDSENVIFSSQEEILSIFNSSTERVLLIGTPGAGKSTFTAWLQRTVLQQYIPRLAIVVRLRDIKEALVPTASELIKKYANAHLRDQLTPDKLGEWIEKGLISFILDGFDEIPPMRRDEVSAWIRGLAEYCDKCPIALTSRPITTDHLEKLGENWREYAVLPFDYNRILDYIQRWHRFCPLLSNISSKVDAAALADEWCDDPVLSHLTGNPLMLSTMLMVHHLDGVLPRGRAKLYDRYIDGMLGLWDSRRQIADTAQLKSGDKRRMLLRIAVDLHTRGEEQIDHGTIINILESIKKDLNCPSSAEGILSALLERSGLLAGPGTYSFIHKSVGEFLVSEAIREGTYRVAGQQKLDRLLLFKERHQDRWNSILFFWAGLAPQVDLQGFIEQLKSSSEFDDFLLACGLLYDQSERIDIEWGSQIVAFLLSKTYSGNSGKGNHHFIGFGTNTRPPGRPAEFHVAIPIIRGISAIGVHVAYLEFLRQFKNNWFQVREGDERVSMPIWAIAIWHARGIFEIKELLLNPPPCIATRPHWKYLALSALAGNLLFCSESLPPESIREFLSDNWPEHILEWPFAILCVLADYLPSFLRPIIDERVPILLERVVLEFKYYLKNATLDLALIDTMTYKSERKGVDRNVDLLRLAQKAVAKLNCKVDKNSRDYKLATEFKDILSELLIRRELALKQGTLAFPDSELK